ncbi:MAG: hypothetical protein AAB654_15425 [Acidobacteriota bacterium]
MPTRLPVQYTIRGIPPDVDQALRRKAHRRKISLNQLLVEELVNATGASPKRSYRSLKPLAGRWKEDPEFDRILADQRQIDWSLWR